MPNSEDTPNPCPQDPISSLPNPTPSTKTTIRPSWTHQFLKDPRIPLITPRQLRKTHEDSQHQQLCHQRQLQKYECDIVICSYPYIQYQMQHRNTENPSNSPSYKAKTDIISNIQEDTTDLDTSWSQTMKTPVNIIKSCYALVADKAIPSHTITWLCGNSTPVWIPSKKSLLA